jgi:dual specificity phosphatase 12
LYPRAVAIVRHLRTLIAPPVDSDAPITTITTTSSISSSSGGITTDGTSASDDTPRPAERYTCMLCGTLLFDSTALQPHAPTEKDAARRGGKNVPCASLFLADPPTFVSAAQLGENSGKIACPNVKCAGKLGQWCWTGCQCSCGAWVTPAFQFTRSKVDVKGPVGVWHFAVTTASDTLPQEAVAT